MINNVRIIYVYLTVLEHICIKNVELKKEISDNEEVDQYFFFTTYN